MKGIRNTPGRFMLPNKLRPDEPLGSYVDFTFYLSTGHESVCQKSCLPQLSGLKFSDFFPTD